MFFPGNQNSHSLSEAESELNSESFCQDISSIPSCIDTVHDVSPWTRALTSENNRYITPPVSNHIYKENLKLKQKIKHLEDTLKKINSKSPYKLNSSGFTQSTNWLLSQKPSFTDFSQDEISVIRNLEKEFNCMDLSSQEIECKRPREFVNNKQPQKFLKLAMMSSIGTLKF